jgi:asparagine synthase (glutamine-hydrolysing)
MDFHRVEVRDRDFIERMPVVTEHFGYPFGMHPNAVPILMVSQLARAQGVKAVLCGEGADECFLGYNWLVPNIRNSIKRFPKVIIRRWSNWLLHAERRLRGKDPTDAPSTADRELVFQLQTGFEKECGPILDPESDVRHVPIPSGGPASQQSFLFFVLRTLLHRNDSMGMAVGIESRFPFLNRDLMRLAVNLPLRSKIRFSPVALDWSHLFLREKWILRQVARRYLPIRMAYRKKVPFPANAYKRMRVAPEWFGGSFISDHFRLSRPRLAYLLEHASPALRMRLFQVDVWGRLFIGGQSADELGAILPRFVGFGGGTPQQFKTTPRRAA